MSDTPRATPKFPGIAIECPENCSTRLRAKKLEQELAAITAKLEAAEKALRKCIEAIMGASNSAQCDTVTAGRDRH